MSDWNDTVIEQFHAGEQRIADRFDRGQLLLLHTTGARSGEPRLSPIAYFRDGSDYLVVASAAGRDQHPGWYFNLLANPAVSAEVWSGDVLETFDAVASDTQGDERDALWAQIVAKAPGFGDYETRTTRTIPVVRLTRV